MEHSSLYNMIKYLTYGTKLHIGVIFLGNNGNKKCELPHAHHIHSAQNCQLLKTQKGGYRRCYKCHNTAVYKAIRTKQPFGGHCINGIYEYTRPVVVNDEVICIIYVGNILTEKGTVKLKEKNISTESMENNFELEKCEDVGVLIESYILTLLEKYPGDFEEFNPLIKNIKSYLNENLEYDISLSAMAKLFNYNPVYLGRIFKKETGMSIKEYVNKKRIDYAKKLLKNNETVTSISLKVGYNNVTYFNSIFKKLVGITPSEYKKESYLN